mgnify:CR=1 FL=1
MALLVGDPARAGASARAIEAHGFEGAFSFEGPHDPFVPLVVAARETTRLELGTAIAVAFARNPMSTAQIAQDLQRVAGARNAGCERTGLVLYDEAGPGVLADLVRAFRGD